jgi:hypothetical protein
MRVLVRDSGGTDGLEIGPHFARAEASSEAGFQGSLHLLGRRRPHCGCPALACARADRWYRSSGAAARRLGHGQRAR